MNQAETNPFKMTPLEAARYHVTIGIRDRHDLAIIKSAEASERAEEKTATEPALSPVVQRTLPLSVVNQLFDELLARQTDGGFAEWFLAKHGHDVRFIHEMNCWAIWDGRRWMVDAARAINELAKDSVQAIMLLVSHERDHERRQKMVSLANRLDNVDKIRKMLEMARTDKRVLTSISDYDQNPLLLNVANGTVDLKDGRLLVHDRSHMMTKIVGIQYDGQAKAPVWASFLDRIFKGHPEVIPFLQRAVGYTLTASHKEHKFFLCYGGGRNGKSTFIETVMAILADYGLASSPETWLRQQGSHAIAEDLARLKGIRMVSTAEIGEGRALDEARVKSVVGGDKITARFLFKNSFDLIPVCKLWISTNHAPQIKGNDEGMWRRVCLIPFEETISYEEMDRDLKLKLAGESVGILAWAVQGCVQWQEGGLQEPDIVKLKTEEYREDQDVVGQFIEDCCDVDAEVRESGTAIYRAYTEWAKVRGMRPMSDTAFGRRLTDRGFENRKAGIKMRIGIALKSDASQDRRYGTGD